MRCPETNFSIVRNSKFHIANREKLLGYHWPYPGLGMAEAKDGAYVYVPAA
jgi:hypothetical protein